MGERMTCPVCDSRTSAVLAAVVAGGDCPYCGASAELIDQVLGLRRQHAESELRAAHERTLIELSQVTTERDQLRSQLADIRQIVNAKGD